MVQKQLHGVVGGLLEEGHGVRNGIGQTLNCFSIEALSCLWAAGSSVFGFS